MTTTRRRAARSRTLRRVVTVVVTLMILVGPLGAAWLSGWTGGQLGEVGWLVLALLTMVAAMGWGLVMSLAGPARPAGAMAHQDLDDVELPSRWKEPAGDREHRRRRERPMTLELPLTTHERLAASP